MFVALEGMDSAGKATQSALLAQRLGAKLFSFPAYDTPMGQAIKRKLYGDWWIDCAPNGEASDDDVQHLEALTLQALMLSNRMEMATELSKAAASGHVVCDRYWASGYAYGKADGLDPEHMSKLHEYLPQPDLNLLLDIDVEESFKRRPERRELYERNAEHLKVVVTNYRELWLRNRSTNPGAWVIVDGRATKEDVEAQINQAVLAWRQIHVRG